MSLFVLGNLFSIAAQAEEHVEAAATPEPIILQYIWVLPLLPLLAFIINGLFGRRLGKAAGPIASVLVFLSFVMSLVVLFDVVNRGEHAPGFEYTLYTWIPSGDFHIDVAFLV